MAHPDDPTDDRLAGASVSDKFDDDDDATNAGKNDRPPKTGAAPSGNDKSADKPDANADDTKRGEASPRSGAAPNGRET
jgi:hypothetical protein